MSDGREELEEIRNFLKDHKEPLKPMFGLMFWQLQEVEQSMTADDFAKQGLSLNLAAQEDEILASFVSHFIRLWRDSQDFNAASRFIASSLDMSADELFQTRALYQSEDR